MKRQRFSTFRSPPIRSLIIAVIASGAIALKATPVFAEAALLVDADSGRVLYAENATQPWYPASVTKIMTAFVILNAVKEGRISFDTPFVVSENAVAQQPSKMGFQAGTVVTAGNALKMLMVKSANDMAVVLAEGLSGSIENFCEEMNRTAQRLGMTQTSYVNPNGLPADGQITSARDLAILARAAIRELPEYGLYWHISAIKFGKRVMRNYNTLIDRYPGADGMKTGFICASGFNLVATATRGSRRLIAVVLGAHSGMARAEKAAQLLERGFTGVSGLSWLTPSFGTVEKLPAIDAAPANLRDEICNSRGRHKRAPPSDNEESMAMGSEPGSPLAMMTGFQLGPPKQGLIGPLQPSMAPIVVYTGPARSPDKIEVATEPAKKKPRRAVARAPAASGEEAPAAGATPAAAKPAAAKPVAPRPVAARPAAPKPAAPKQAAAKPDNAKPMPLNTGAKPAARAAALPDGAAKPKPKPKPKPVTTEQQ